MSKLGKNLHYKNILFAQYTSNWRFMMSKIFTITLRHWQPLIFLNLVILGITAATITVSSKVWMATTQLTMPKNNANLDANLGILGSLRNSGSEMSSLQDQQLKMQESILTSDSLLESIIAKDPEKNKFTTNNNNYKKLFKVSIDDSTRIINLSVHSSSPELARQRAINLINAYQQRLNQLRLANRNTKRQFSQTELDIAKRKLEIAQQTLAQFKQSTGIVDAEEQTKSIISTIDYLSKTQAEASSQAEYSQNRTVTLSSRLKMVPDRAINSLSLGENKDYQFLKTKLAEVNAELTQKRSSFTEEHPSVQKLLQQQQTLLNQMQSEVDEVGEGKQIDTTVSSQGEGRSRLIEQLILAETEASAQQRRAQQLQSQLQQLKSTLKSIPPQQAKLLELQRQVDVAEGVYKGLVAQVQQTNIDVFDVYPNVEILEQPRVDPKPIEPKLSLIVLNALLAAVIGSIALILLLERRNPLLSPQDLQDMKFPIVVSVPRIKLTNAKWQEGEETEVEFQRLASSVSLQPLDNRRLLITSAIEGEGKTTVTLGLARALLDLGFRVLMVDGDFYQAELTHRLLPNLTFNSTQQPISITSNLDLLPAAPQQKKIIEMISQGSFERTLVTAESYSQYDYVLVDSAPVSTTTATALMTAQIPNVLFVVRPESSYSNSVRNSLEQLIQHRAQILGLVVNGIETASKAYKSHLHEVSTKP
jgi:polysaccharide biosynthesis transport protein